MTRPREGEVVPGLGARIRELRDAAGLTQGQVWELCGVKIETMSRVENAASTPDLDTLARIASGLGVGIAELFPRGDGVAAVDPEVEVLVARIKKLGEEDRRLVSALMGRLTMR